MSDLDRIYPYKSILLSRQVSDKNKKKINKGIIGNQIPNSQN